MYITTHYEQCQAPKQGQFEAKLDKREERSNTICMPSSDTQFKKGEPRPESLATQFKKGELRPDQGRPTKYREAMIEEVNTYLASVDKKHLPKIESFAKYLDVNEDQLNEWRKKYPLFHVALLKIKRAQAERLIDDGIYGQTNATIVKLMLMNNHGMREKTDSEVTGKDGGDLVIKIISEDKKTYDDND